MTVKTILSDAWCWRNTISPANLYRDKIEIFRDQKSGDETMVHMFVYPWLFDLTPYKKYQSRITALIIIKCCCFTFGENFLFLLFLFHFQKREKREEIAGGGLWFQMCRAHNFVINYDQLNCVIHEACYNISYLLEVLQMCFEWWCAKITQISN